MIVKTTTETTTIDQYQYDLTSPRPDWHATTTISLGELADAGFWDPSDETWTWDYYNKEQYDRVSDKILKRFFDREISILPPGAWKRQFIRTMNEIMPKYKLLYARLDEGLDILQESDEYYKSRDVTSAYPQTQISGVEDYATGGRDNEYERIVDGNAIDNIMDYYRRYKDVDVMILEDLEPLFSGLISNSLNAIL